MIFTTRQLFQQELQRADSPLLAEAAEIGARRIFVDGLVRLPESNGGDPRDAFHLLAEGLHRENLTAMLRAGIDVYRPCGRPSARGVRRGHDHPPQHRAGPARRAAVTRGREVARPRVCPGTPHVPDHQWPGARGLSSRPSAPRPAARSRRRVRPDHPGHDRRSRPRRAGERRVFRREHDARRRHLGRGEERHGPACSSPKGSGAASAAS